MKGKPWRVPLPAFGEAVEFKKKARMKLSSRWEEGIFLGVVEVTTEKIVGNINGVFTVQSIQRKPEDERWNLDLIKSITGVPWMPNPGEKDPTELKEPIIIFLRDQRSL